MVSTQTILLLLPELVLTVCATAILLAGTVWKDRTFWSWCAAASVLAAGFVMATVHAQPVAGPVVADSLAGYGRWLTLAAGLMLCLTAQEQARSPLSAEYCGTLLYALIGLLLVSSSNDLAVLFLGLELVSIPTYILLYLGRTDAQATESSLKYFFLSILSSAIFLYGTSFLYGLSGTTSLDTGASIIAGGLASAAETSKSTHVLGALGMVLIFAGLSFRMSAVPFHFYTPDVFQGTSHANAGLLSAVPKIAGVMALLRIIATVYPQVDFYGWRVAILLAVLTMTLGNVLALWQTQLRRMLAYSSIAHSGFMLLGLAASLSGQLPGTGSASEGQSAMLLYLAVYVFSSVGLFATLSWISGDGHTLETVQDLAGLGKRCPLAGGIACVCIFSLAGLPPLAGFWGKFQVFFAALGVGTGEATVRPMQAWFIGVAVIAALNAAIGAAYYLRLIGMMYFAEQPRIEPVPTPNSRTLAGTLGMLVTVLLGISPGWLAHQAHLAAPGSKPAVGPAPIPMTAPPLGQFNDAAPADTTGQGPAGAAQPEERTTSRFPIELRSNPKSLGHSVLPFENSLSDRS